MHLEPLDQLVAWEIDHWGEDQATERYLGRSSLHVFEWLGKTFASGEAVGKEGWVAWEGETPVGLLSLEVYADGSIWIAMEVAPQHRGRGVASSMLHELQQLDTYGDSVSMWAHVEDGNKASARALEKAGFVFDSITRSGMDVYVWYRT